MKTELIYFEVTPRVVRANTKSVITIRPRYEHSRFRDGQVYELGYYPTEELTDHTGWDPKNARRTVTPVDGVLKFEYFFEGEQEHVLHLDTFVGEDRRPVGTFRVYSVEDDLFGRMPYKGDIHMHSNRSDGREEPGYVAGACRRIGLDFMALTDHKRYAPSLESIAAYADIEHDLRIYPGEEVHPPLSPLHIINFAGGFSVNELFATQQYKDEVAALQERLGALPPGVDPYVYAASVWSFDKIREGGGLAVFCHPYWFTSFRYAPAVRMTDYMFETQPYDAYEVIGGFHRWEAESNTLQVARYGEERAKGRIIPIVGVSDSHGCERDTLFGWYYTIVFSPSLDAPDLIDSVKQLYSVAVEAMPGEMPRAYGPFRLVKYALFLLREIFPEHDALCQEEGRLMLEYLQGQREAADVLAKLNGRCAALLRRCFGN